MSHQKLHQNRAVVLGCNYADARHFAERHPDITEHAEVTLVAANSHRVTILGGVAGMHIAVVYMTPSAHRGEHFAIAQEALQRCLARTGGKVIHLDSEGGSHESI